MEVIEVTACSPGEEILSNCQKNLLRVIPTMTFQNSHVDITLVVYFSP